MGNLKSHCLLWTALATHPRYRDFIEEADIKTFSVRSRDEGLSFLTRTLPNLGKAIDAFHATTAWEPPPGFQSDGDGIPLFMGKCISLALIGNSIAVDCVRQLSYLFYKLEADYDEDIRQKFIDQFVTTDRDLHRAVDFNNVNVQAHTADMRRIVTRILCNLDPGDIRPCHGSGVTACRTLPQDKWHKLRYFPKLDAVFPYADYFFFNYNHLLDDYERLVKSQESDPCARVVLVPKDSRGPRIISCEPAELMYIQQGLMRKLYDHLETHHVTRGQINFTDQEINRTLAWYGSKTDQLATIDLSEASDRVSLELVRRVFPERWFEAFEASRSEYTVLPSGEKIKLNKFAPMGSSCCFPVEALVFWTSAQATLRRLTGEKNFTNKVYVYGDDIIIDSNVASEIMKDFEIIGFKINYHKSFLKGPFRESCGGDYHNGYDVTPIRLKKDFDKSCTSILASADFFNNLVEKFGKSDHLFSILSIIESSVGYQFPQSELRYPSVVRHAPIGRNKTLFKRRFHESKTRESYQREEFRILQPTARELPLREANWCELLRKELSVAGFDSDTESTRLVKPRRSMDPGVYVDDHSIRMKWSWVWLGEPERVESLPLD